LLEELTTGAISEPGTMLVFLDRREANDDQEFGRRVERPRGS